RNFVITMSPSMDILVSSNLERLLFSLCNENGAMVQDLMLQLSKAEEYKVNAHIKEGLRNFPGGYASESATAEAIRQIYKQSGYVIDTHTAVAYSVYRKYREMNSNDKTKTIIVSTASPYKFTAAVMESIDSKYSGLDDFELVNEMGKLLKTELPKGIKDLDKRPILHRTVCEKHEMKEQVEKILTLNILQ
ncbi:MAG TPA: threonine synthase, partial [Patescibacteria group bacterium]|nr:threonine synthase [Patescibacteria group bacterium]